MALGWLFVPVYANLLGVEAYGLVGFYTVLLGLLSFLDIGLSGTLNREVARLSASGQSASQCRELVRTIETVFWGISITIAVGIVAGSALIAVRWVTVETLTVTQVQNAVVLMGLAVSLQLPSAMYLGGLMGLQRQVLSNGIVIAAGLVRGLGAVAVLVFVSPSIEAYFWWQVAVNAGQVVAIRHALWRALPVADRPPSFRPEVLRGVWRYSAGMAGITVLSGVLTQIDKLVVSRTFTLEVLGYYSLASVVAQVPLLLSRPMTNALFPRMTELVSANDLSRLVVLYHRSSQVVAALVLPPALLLVAFPGEVVLAWTGDVATAQQTGRLVAVLVAGSACLALTTVPHVLTLASGWTDLSLKIGLAGAAATVPVLMLLVDRIGVVGACVAWMLLNGLSLPAYIAMLHRRLPLGSPWHWYVADVLPPALVSGAFLGLAKWLVPPPSSRLELIIWIVGLAGLALLGSALSSSETRRLAAGFASGLGVIGRAL
ncbi:MAG: oligosaccharide flippase family protein [Anaerolineae bacterium]|nr:oligosaccharide flippase family protein [Anaerolineae bacterium]